MTSIPRHVYVGTGRTPSTEFCSTCNGFYGVPHQHPHPFTHGCACAICRTHFGTFPRGNQGHPHASHADALRAGDMNRTIQASASAPRNDEPQLTDEQLQIQLTARLNELCAQGKPGDAKFDPPNGHGEGKLIWMIQPFDKDQYWGYVVPLGAESYSSEHAVAESDEDPVSYLDVLGQLVYRLEEAMGLTDES